MKNKVLNKSLLFFSILLSACGTFIPQIALADIKEYPAETTMNFISYTPETPVPTPGGGSTQTGDVLFWIIVALCAIIIITGITAIIISGRNKKKFKNNQPSVKNLLSVLVLPLIISGSLLYCIDRANAASQEFVSPTMDIYVNTEGGPVHYGEGETSNIQKYTNTIDSVIFIDEINLKGESTTKFIGNWKATLEDGTVIFEGGINDSYILDEPIVLEPNESFKTTWTTETDSKELLSLTGTAPATICYKTYDAQRIVTFDSNGGSEVPSQHIYYGDKVTKPVPDPAKNNSDFIYWATDNTLTNEYDFGAAVYEDLTLYAKWAATEEYKAKVIEDINNQAEEVKEIIDNNPNLTETEKVEAKAKIDEDTAKEEEKQDNSNSVAGAEVAIGGLALAGAAIGSRRRLRGKHERIESNFKRFKRWYL